MRILVGSALAPAPVADRTFKPLRTHAARSATYLLHKTYQAIENSNLHRYITTIHLIELLTMIRNKREKLENVIK